MHYSSGYILANWSITMGMSSHFSVSHCFSVSLSGARGDWDSAEDLCMQLALHNNIGMAILIAHAQLGVVMTCNRCVNEIELHS